MRPFRAFFKLVQRQAYSCLSTRSGIWFCLGGLIILAISAFQFGELLLEWSMQRYNVAFSASHDNIAGKTFQSRLCLPGPIDVVYTWVNGSDPNLIAELNFVKSQLLADLNQTANANEDGKISDAMRKPRGKQQSNSEEKFRWNYENECPFPNCVPFNAVAVSGLQKNISEMELSGQNMFLPGFQFSTFDLSIDPSVKVLVFEENFDLSTMKNSTIKFKSKQKKFSRVFVTSTIRIGATKLDNIGIINNVPKDLTIKMIQDALHKEKLESVSVAITLNTSVIKFDNSLKAKHFLGPLRGKLMINGYRFKVQPATLVWKPLTSLEVGRDIIEEDVATSRFADNEELRYSLRSVEKYAPWIRNIIIVTNGQIPSWLNLDHPRIRIVTHMELFSNKSHLPTFSSPAIETHIHKIPGLSKKFIYMNDDVFFGDYVWPDNFFTHSQGQKIYLTWPVPNCNEGCPASWVSDRYCDKPCNVSECDWDGGDCLNTKGKPGFPNYSFFHGLPHSAIAEYCNGGCADSWIGDRYCDANCNVAECGYDAGDCGLDEIKQLFSINAQNIVGPIVVPPGARAFYVNFTEILRGGVIADGNYIGSTVVRTAIFSKKFKIMTITFYANLTGTVSFEVSGFKTQNHTFPMNLNFSISVDTTKEALKTTQLMHTNVAIQPADTVRTFPKPYTVYSAGSKEMNQSTSIAKSSFDIKTINEVLGWYQATNREIPVKILEELNTTDTELKDGDITEKGYQKKKFQIIYPFYASNQDFKGDNQEEHRRTRRHLLFYSHSQKHSDVEKQTAANRVTKSQQKGRNSVKIVDGEFNTNGKGRDHSGINSGVANLRRWLSKYGHWDPIKEVFATSPHPWERQNFFADILSAYQRLERQKEYTSERKPGRMLLDTFASSLLHVSRIYNHAFGYKARKVPAHMPHFVDVDVINEMQERFQQYFEETSSHKIRMQNDMQFAFSYAYYLMDVPESINMSAVFNELDTDGSNTLSEREVRTLAAKMYSLPLQTSDVQTLEAILMNCSKAIDEHGKSVDRASLVVTHDLISHCQPIAKTLMDEIKRRRYKFEVVGDEDITFKMIRNNVSHLIYQLDWIRKNRRKFVCLNDNIDHDNPQSKVIRTILKDFLEYLFPEPSQFELPRGFRNKFLKTSELKKWKDEAIEDEEKMRLYLFVVLILLLIFIIRRQVFKLYTVLTRYLHRKRNSNRGLSFDQKETFKI